MSGSQEFDVCRPTRICDQCGIPMRVFGLEPHATFVGVAVRSLECPQCENLQTDMVPSAQEWLDPPEENPVNPTSGLSVGEGFDAEIVDLFGSAFEAAWQSLQVSDSRLTHEPHIAYTRELLAKWILCWVSKERGIAISLSRRRWPSLQNRILTPALRQVRPGCLPRANRRAFTELTLTASVQCPIGGNHHEQSVFWAASKRPPEK